MRPRHVVPTLAALAMLPAGAHAFEIAAGDWELAIEPRIQTRIAVASASDAAGDDYDIWERRTTENPQAINFFLRRTRLYFKGGHSDGWKFNVTLQADNVGREDDRDNDDVAVRYAWVGKKFERGDIDHYLQFGLDKHTAVMADVDSSSKQLFPNGRLAEGYNGPRSIGIDYALAAPAFGLRTGLADEAGDDNNDWHFYARVYTGLTETLTIHKRTESFLGKEGVGHQLGAGVDVKTDGSDATDGTEDDDFVQFTVDYLLHYHQLSALFDFVLRDRGEAIGDNSGYIALVQAGWAVPRPSGHVVEPALRLTLVDNDDDNDDEMGVLDREGGDSGFYVDAGVNYYLDGHSNKFQLAVQIYSPEEGDGDAVAVRLNHQLDF